MPFRTPPERRLREVHSPDRRHIRRAKCIRQRAATPGMMSPFLTLPLPLWPPEPKSPYLRSGKCLFRVRIQPDVKARFLDFKPATHRGGHFSHRNDAVPAQNRAPPHATPARRFAAVCRHLYLLSTGIPYLASTVLVSSCGRSVRGSAQEASKPLDGTDVLALRIKHEPAHAQRADGLLAHWGLLS